MIYNVSETALRALGVRLVVLFGSRARGDERPSSDTDIGVVMDGPVPGLMDPRRAHIVEALGISGEIDLVFLDEADPLLLHEVATSASALFEGSAGDFEQFRVRAVKRFYDTAWIRRLESDSLDKRFA